MLMNDSDWKEIKSARPSNIARAAANIIFLIIYSVYDFGFALYFGVLVFFISLFWFWFMENRFKTYKEYPLLWYIPASIDILFITVCVYYTGLSYSPALLGYVYSTATSSIDLIRARGLYNISLGSNTNETKCISLHEHCKSIRHRNYSFLNFTFYCTPIPCLRYG